LPADVGARLLPIVSCDLFVFILINEAEPEGVSFSLTPDQNAAHGKGPDFLDLIDDFLDAPPGTIIELPGDVDLDLVDDAPAGAALGPFPAAEPDDAYAHGFEAFEGLVVRVEVFVGDDPEPVFDEEFSWDAHIEDLDCPGEDGDEDDEAGEDGGQGGELPATGAAPALLVAGGAALLGLGGGLYLAGRRRPETPGD
jgi:LPXTG-motif cell wall-anchored protein